MIRARRLRARSARCSWSSGGRTHSFTLCGCLNLRGNVPCVRSLYTCPGATQVLRNADAEWSKKTENRWSRFTKLILYLVLTLASREHVKQFIASWFLHYWKINAIALLYLKKFTSNTEKRGKKAQLNMKHKTVKHEQLEHVWQHITGSSVCQCGRERDRKETLTAALLE